MVKDLKELIKTFFQLIVVLLNVPGMLFCHIAATIYLLILIIGNTKLLLLTEDEKEEQIDKPYKAYITKHWYLQAIPSTMFWLIILNIII